MEAIAVVPGTKNVKLVDRPEPNITADDEIKIRILRVGICGTDREEAAGGRALAPEGKQDLVLGHEMFGQVEAVGAKVTRVRPGDYAVFTVRRGCGQCLPCAMGRSDMCLTGKYRERGIWGLDGYQTRHVVDREQYVARVPQEIADVGVLVEPFSIVEKAIDEALRIQFARLPAAHARPNWLFGRRCLVAGLGPVGLLAAVALRLRGAEVFGLDVVDPSSARPEWLKQIGGKYIDGRQVPARSVDETIGPMDFIVEAAGVAALQFNLLDALDNNGVYALTGIPGGDRLIQLEGPDLIRSVVLQNLAMVGSVNAARDHFQMAVDDLVHARLLWGDHLGRLITNRVPHADFAVALDKHTPDEIKAVIEWDNPAVAHV